MRNVLTNVVSGFITTVKGMVVTGREMFRRPITLKYPYEKREVPYRFRGMLVNDVTICGVCQQCARICPSSCLEMKGEKVESVRRPKYWKIDYSKCCWCNLCVEVCPDHSLVMSHEYEMVFTDRTKMIRDFVADPIPPYKEKDPRKSSPEEKEENTGEAAA